jgi:S-adenosylmethionine decarboxylase
MEEYSTFGRHVAMDAWGVPFDLLNNAEELKKYMIQAAESLWSICSIGTGPKI